MARKDALLRLHEKLREKRDELRDSLNQEMDLGQQSREVGDVGDDAVNDTEKELNSQLMAFESRELAQIERAIEMIRTGRFGDCELCQKKIPITRLNALPFTPFCVKCQEKVEQAGGDLDQFDIDWENAADFEFRMQEMDLTLGDLDQHS
ncbi:MAG: TraR/DksA family transcriptional regulator [Planctomycetaceae bacterium]|nr:TraR/DksA family transcriptional regulator [Planctomycetaceae bacterium]